MIGGLFGLLVFVFLAAAALFSLWLHPHLPERYYMGREEISGIDRNYGALNG